MNEIIKKYNLDKSTWTPKEFHGVLHTFFPVGESGFPLKKFFNDSSTITLFFVKDNYVFWYWNDNDLTRLRDLFFKRLKSSPNYLRKLQKKWYDSLKIFDTTIKKVHKTDLTKLSNSELSDLYDKFYKDYLEEFTYFMILGDAISMHAEKYLVPEFKKVLGNNFIKIFPQFITTTHKSFIEEEEQNRKKLTKKLQENKKLSKKLLDNHSAKYFYIKNNYAQAIYLTSEDFEQMIHADFKKNVRKIKNNKTSSFSKQQLIKKYKLSPWHKTLLYVMDEFFGIQDTRKKYVLISNYYQFKFLYEAERRTNIPFKSLQYSIYPEFRNILNKKIDDDIFKKRRKICLCIQTSNNYEIITGESASKILKFFTKSKDQKQAINGIIASRGKTQGRVKIILKIHDMINITKGDILITSMTRPEMMPAIKKAAAIVTDEGGITCHAAIVAREMNKPCIIGTKIATKVLKDGDKVEVDANKGVVRKIK